MPHKDTSFGFKDLGVREDFLPPEYRDREDFFRSLDERLAHQERKNLERLYEEQEGRGLFRSGQTERRALEEVAFPGIEARRGALFGLLEKAREERLSEKEFQRTRQLQGEEWQRRLQELGMKLHHQRAMLEAQAALGIGGGGGGDDFGSTFTRGFASSLGQNLAGGFFHGSRA